MAPQARIVRTSVAHPASGARARGRPRRAPRPAARRAARPAPRSAAREVELAVHRPPGDRATSALTPSAPASSSMHSTVIMVEIHVADQEPLGPLGGRHHRHVDAAASSACRTAASAGRRRRPSTTNSQASAVGEPARPRRARARPRRPPRGSSGAAPDRRSGRPTEAIAARTAAPAAPEARAMTGLIVIGGPTASGKSALALRLAEALGGVIVNADSMQLYRELPLLTARPTPADEARAPHRLYGVLDAADPASVGRWLELAGRRSRQASAPAGCRSWSAAPASICTRCCTVSRRCPGAGRGPPPTAGAVRRLGAPGSTPSSRAAIRRWRRGCARATGSGCCAPTRCWRRPAARSPTGRQQPRCGCACRRRCSGIALLPPRAALHGASSAACRR